MIFVYSGKLPLRFLWIYMQYPEIPNVSFFFLSCTISAQNWSMWMYLQPVKTKEIFFSWLCVCGVWVHVNMPLPYLEQTFQETQDCIIAILK